MNTAKNKAVLYLKDGTVFNGFAVGKIGTTYGNICFNTALTGYQEAYTDPASFGKIIVETGIHIGNIGIAKADNESDSVKVAGIVCRNFAENHSRPKSDGSLHDYFIENGIVGIEGVDTRAIAQYIRDNGEMEAVISSENLDPKKLKTLLEKKSKEQAKDLSKAVSTKKSYTAGKDSAKHRIAVLDLGVKKTVVDLLVSRKSYCNVFPAETSFDEILKFKPNGILISDGPGNPENMDYVVEIIKKAVDNNIAVFGINLGHLLLGKAFGMKVYKLPNSHRGLNHPVRDLENKRDEITSQNHSHALQGRASDVEITHTNLNDDSIEGIKIKGKPAFSVQFNPESSPGTFDTHYLFDNFIKLLKK